VQRRPALRVHHIDICSSGNQRLQCFFIVCAAGCVKLRNLHLDELRNSIRTAFPAVLRRAVMLAAGLVTDLAPGVVRPVLGLKHLLCPSPRSSVPAQQTQKVNPRRQRSQLSSAEHRSREGAEHNVAENSFRAGVEASSQRAPQGIFKLRLSYDWEPERVQCLWGDVLKVGGRLDAQAPQHMSCVATPKQLQQSRELRIVLLAVPRHKLV
jgi:hypothetical protein